MKEQLTEISQKAQAETIDLWPEIYGELKETKTVKHPKLNYQLARLAAVFSLFFVGALVVYAVVHQIYVDTGLEGARAERLVTPIDMSITKDGVTITIDWAYADVSRVSVGYTIYDEEGQVLIPETEMRYPVDLYIRPVGREGYGPWITASTGAWYTYRTNYEQQVYTENFGLMDLPDEIDNGMEIDLQMNFEGQSYRFVFSISVYPAQFEIRDVEMLSDSMPSFIQEFSITPTLTILQICFDIPYEYQGQGGVDTIWGASNIKIYFNGQDVAELYPDVTGYFAPVGHAWNLGCTLFTLDIPMDVLPETVRITFDEWREDYSWNYPSLEDAEELVAIYQANGLNAATYEYRGEIGVNWGDDWWELPAFERQALYDAVMDDYFATNPENFRITGPWEIEFELQDPLN